MNTQTQYFQELLSEESITEKNIKHEELTEDNTEEMKSES